MKAQSIYRMARESGSKRLSIEAAARELHVSPSSLYDYERGTTIPPEDVVCRMIEVYGARWLVYQHIQQNTPLGAFFPAVNIHNLCQTVLQLEKELEDVQKQRHELVRIALDGSIDKAESKRWDKLCKEFMEAAGVLLALNAWSPMEAGGGHA